MSICGFSNPFFKCIALCKVIEARDNFNIHYAMSGIFFCSDVDYATGSYFDFRGLRLSDGRLLDIPPGSWYPVSLAPRNLILTVKSQVGGGGGVEGGRGAVSDHVRW